MIKTVAKILITIIFIILITFYYKQEKSNNLWGSYTPIIFDTVDDADRGVQLLDSLGHKDIIHLNRVEIGINNYLKMEERNLDTINSTLDKNDYRYDSFISSMDILFSSSDKNSRIVYIKLSSSELLPMYNIYKIFSDNAISYQLGNPLFLRTTLNYICLILILLLFSIGCRNRFLISIATGVLAFFFFDPSSPYSFICFTTGYFLIIMIVESFSFSNRYIKRNNVGLFRVILYIMFFASPTVIPSFLDFSQVIYTPVSVDSETFNYESMENLYSKDSPSISNYFTHYAFQKSFLYGTKYMFPSYENSVTIDEFNKEDYYLSRYIKIVDKYDEEFLEEFLDYCDTTVLGRFYLDYGRPFKLELNSLLSLYILEKEYMQIGILAFVMLISSLFFKKNGEKKLKY